jgi:8-oxo-dGTP diphosphatase
MPNAFRILVGVLAFHRGSLLLLKRSESETFLPGAWGIPAGKVGFGEEIEAAAHRELGEEAGLQGRLRCVIGVSKFMSQYQGTDLHNLQVNVIIDVASAGVKLDHSNSEYKWIDPMTFDFEETDEFTTNTIRQAFELS